MGRARPSDRLWMGPGLSNVGHRSRRYRGKKAAVAFSNPLGFT